MNTVLKSKLHVVLQSFAVRYGFAVEKGLSLDEICEVL
jgi:hypothetical protein